jgi:hypothetical protein
LEARAILRFDGVSETRKNWALLILSFSVFILSISSLFIFFFCPFLLAPFFLFSVFNLSSCRWVDGVGTWQRRATVAVVMKMSARAAAL